MADDNEKKDTEEVENQEEETKDENRSIFDDDMKELSYFTDWMEKQSLLVKLLFCIPLLDVTWGVYRLFKALLSKDMVRIIVAILLLIPGTTVTWIIDLIWVLVKGNGFWF